jgi:hypothetical protein
VKAWPMFCKHCGQRIGRTEMFCVRCGQTISQEEFESDASHAENPKAVTSLAGVSQRGTSVFDLAPETGNAVKAIQPAQLPSRDEPLAPSPIRREPRYVPVRKNSFPIIELLVAILLVAGAVAAIWIFHSTIQKRGLTESGTVIVNIAPAGAKLRMGKSAEFSATVSGSEGEVNWSIEEGDAGGRIVMHGAKAEVGKISSLVTYTAPKKAGTYHLKAASKSNPEISATAAISVRK